jgi:hypothetical protein
MDGDGPLKTIHEAWKSGPSRAAKTHDTSDEPRSGGTREPGRKSGVSATNGIESRKERHKIHSITSREDNHAQGADKPIMFTMKRTLRVACNWLLIGYAVPSARITFVS